MSGQECKEGLTVIFLLRDFVHMLPNVGDNEMKCLDDCLTTCDWKM